MQKTAGVHRRVEVQKDTEPVDYAAAVSAMEDRVADISSGSQAELLWFLEHPAVYTAGTSARDEDLIDATRFPVHRTGRGGQYTYHGPGQRIVYVMLDIRDRFGGDVRAFVSGLEASVIDAIAEFGLEGCVHCDRVGVWVARPDLGQGREDKIAALGIRIRRGISFHGLALNVDVALDHFSGIVPCGISEHGVTSLHALGIEASIGDVDAALLRGLRNNLGIGPE